MKISYTVRVRVVVLLCREMEIRVLSNFQKKVDDLVGSEVTV